MVMSSTRVALALVCLVGVSACAASQPPAGPVARLPTEQFAPQITSVEREFGLVAHREGLSPRQREEVARLVADWRAEGGGPIVVKIPVRAVQDTLLAADRLEDFLRGNGVGPGQIQRVGYEAGADAQAQLRIGFLAQIVEIPACGLDHGNLVRTGSNQVSPNFGCAVSANIAAMAANPADLTRSRPEDPADAARRQVVLDNYRQGELTSTVKDAQANGSLSEIVQ
jgi:pilus assembly protein CpaD